MVNTTYTLNLRKCTYVSIYLKVCTSEYLPTLIYRSNKSVENRNPDPLKHYVNAQWFLKWLFQSTMICSCTLLSKNRLGFRFIELLLNVFKHCIFQNHSLKILIFPHLQRNSFQFYSVMHCLGILLIQFLISCFTIATSKTFTE